MPKITYFFMNKRDFPFDFGDKVKTLLIEDVSTETLIKYSIEVLPEIEVNSISRNGLINGKYNICNCFKLDDSEQIKEFIDILTFLASDPNQACLKIDSRFSEFFDELPF